MKRILLIAVALLALNVSAQENQNPKGKMQQKADFTPEQIATLKTKHMALDLDLNETQQQKIQQLNLENAKLHKTKREEFKKRKETKRERPSSEERFNMKNAQLDRAIAQKKQMRSVLSDEQFEKWEKMRHRKNMKRNKMKRRHRMHKHLKHDTQRGK